jgi:hypothetical protein
MLVVAAGAAAIATWAAYTYVRREGFGLEGLGLAFLRTVGLTALLILLVNPVRATRVPGGSPVVLLDESLSMSVGGRWKQALDTATALSGTEGTVLRFGSEVVPFDTTPPRASSTRLAEALYTASAMGGPVYVVTDGEIEDLGSLVPSALQRTTFVTLPRDTVPDAALLGVDIPRRVHHEDSILVELMIGTWGVDDSSSVTLEALVGERSLVKRSVRLPPAPAVSRRRLIIPPSSLSVGTHAVTFRASLSGDEIRYDDERARVVTVTEQPAVVVLVDSPDWEGKFLAAELGRIANTSFKAYAHVAPEEWLDMELLTRASWAQVRDAARRAGLLIVRADLASVETLAPNGRSVWYWPAGVDSVASLLSGDWYLSDTISPSPLAAALGRVEWDSLPPLVGLIPLGVAAGGWVAISARLGRRGAERPVVHGYDSAGTRKMTTVGTGLWRWAFRGGASREAYRTLLAAGVDWLLGGEPVERGQSLVVSSVVTRGEPVVFSWDQGRAPDSLVVSFGTATQDTVISAVLSFDGEGTAVQHLPPGVYRWRVPEDRQYGGLVVVESYSEEYPPRVVGLRATEPEGSLVLMETSARDCWILYVLVVLALAGEWAWRHQRGLP